MMRSRTTLSPLEKRNALLSGIAADNWKIIADQLAELRRQNPLPPFSPALLTRNKIFILHYLLVLSTSNSSAILVLSHLLTGYKAYFEGELTWRTYIKSYGYSTPMEIATIINNQTLISCFYDNVSCNEILTKRNNQQEQHIRTLTAEIEELNKKVQALEYASQRLQTALEVPPLDPRLAPPHLNTIWRRRTANLVEARDASTQTDAAAPLTVCQ